MSTFAAGTFTTRLQDADYAGMVVVVNLTKGKALVSFQRTSDARPCFRVLESEHFVSIQHQEKAISVVTTHGSDRHTQTCVHRQDATIHLLDEEYMARMATGVK